MSKIKTAAIVIDDWKLAIFKKTLDKEGYKYSQVDGPVKGLITLSVETSNIAKLAPIVKKINNEANRSKKH